jgi:hypothetical protein
MGMHLLFFISDINRVARWFIFKPKIPIWVNFGMENVGFL